MIREDKDKLEEKTLLMHIKFEEIHPFEDGNGRVGRILWNIQRLMLGLPLKIIHTGKEQFDYYKIFNKTYVNTLEEKIKN
jgi:Fic family protein